MTDIHCHILNSIDDGAQSLSESVEMLECAKENGIDTVVLTPHIKCSDNAEAFITQRDALIEELKDEISDMDCPEIFAGAEVYVDENIFYCNTDKLTVNNTDYLLVEFDFESFLPSRVEKYLSEIISDGKIPVFAHPERYEFCQNDYNFINYLSDKGVLFQINAPSLAGLGSEDEFLLAREMVKKQVATFIATDSHSLRYRGNEMLKFISGFPRELDSQYLDYMLNEAPKIMLDGKEIQNNAIGQLIKPRGRN